MGSEPAQNFRQTRRGKVTHPLPLSHTAHGSDRRGRKLLRWGRSVAGTKAGRKESNDNGKGIEPSRGTHPRVKAAQGGKFKESGYVRDFYLKSSEKGR